ncbi:MAG: triose-phosphate isomerase [Dehalococcoidia bacterium]|nr:triose-phosphate isomerase [Dehalococcoidia bacterium]
MRIPLIAGNWKMNTTVAEAVNLVHSILDRLDKIEGVEKLLCPPFVSLFTMKELLKGSSIKLGAQNMYFKTKGAYTGEISPLMLSELCEFVILGHSERRGYFGETDEIVNRKVKAALVNNLKPIVCIGETPEDNETGRAEEVLYRQLNQSLNDIEPIQDIVIAYEPIWAIGTGKAASGEQSAVTIDFIRNTMTKLWGKRISQDLRILYGGSVTSHNIAEFISQPEIDGALVGGSSLKPKDFLDITNQAATIKVPHTSTHLRTKE